MRKLLMTTVAVAGLGLLFTACNKDISESDLFKNQIATADSLLKRGGIIKYTVKIVSTANSTILKGKMELVNAQVTIYQNDSIFTAYTDANGFATFNNMRIGTAAVNVKLTGHAEVDYVADLTPADNLVNISENQMINTVRYASTLVPMFPIVDPGAATITGKVTAELDLTNTTPEPAPGVTVTAMVDVDDTAFVDRYIKPTQGTTNSNAGRIVKYAFQDSYVTAVTNDKGEYSLKVPAALNGLPIKLSVQDYQATQKLYLENDPADGTFKPGAYDVSVLFSSNVEPSDIPIVKPVYVVVDEPTAPIGIVYKNASFTFDVDANGGISKVNVIDKGRFSSKPALLVIDNSNIGNGAILDPVFNSSTGEIDDVTVVNSGNKYQKSTLGYSLILLQTKRKAVFTPSIDNSGNLYNMTINDRGYGYITKPNLTFITPLTNTIAPNFYLDINYYVGGEIPRVRCLSSGSNYKSVVNYPETKSNIKGLNSTSILLNSGNIIIKNIELNTGYRNK